MGIAGPEKKYEWKRLFSNKEVDKQIVAELFDVKCNIKIDSGQR